jgi:nucleotide-binding universal stress UspA family protein
VVEDERHQDALRETLTRRAAEAGLSEAAVRVRRGETVEQIVHEQRDAPYDFVVAGAGELESMRGLRRSESVGEELALRLNVPLLLARGRPKKPESLLICTAVGEPGKSDVRAGGWLARRLGATATLLHVLKPGEAAQPLALAHLDRGVATLRELGVTSRYSVRPALGPTEGILAELSERPRDLVVIGAGPRGGSVTRRVVRECGRSILVVPEGSW